MFSLFIARLWSAQNIEIVALCEPDVDQRKFLASRHGIAFTHDSASDLLRRVDCDAVVIGDVYARRGTLAVKPWKRIRHVLSDKPICTELKEWRRIEELCRQKGLEFGCQFDLRDTRLYRRAEGHPQRPAGKIWPYSSAANIPCCGNPAFVWYFEPGMHGGTINDIAVHALDVIPWITGSPVSRIEAARTWNACTPDVPDFCDGAQLMFSLENQAGVIGDVSYFSPDSQGYALPHYWRMVFWGEKGMLETACGSDSLLVALEGETKPRALPLPAGRCFGYLEDFRSDIMGTADGDSLTTQEVLTAARFALLAQCQAFRTA